MNRRINHLLATAAVLLQTAIGSVLSRESASAFKEMVDSLDAD